MRRIITIYRYIYFRYTLFQKKQWNSDEKLATLNSGFGISSSTIAFIYSIDLIIRKIFSIQGFFYTNSRIIGLCIVVFFLNVFILGINDKKLNKEFTKNKESSLSWKVKGFFSLLYIFGPIVLLIILIWV